MSETVRLTVPGALTWIGRTPLVTIGTIDVKAMAAPFLHQALATMQVQEFRSLDSCDEPGEDDNFCIAGAVMHMSRCGSTLLCRQFEALDQVAVLSEPFIFQQLLEGPSASVTVTRRRIRTLAGWWRDALTPIAQHIVIKWPLAVGYHAATITDALPEVPTVLLHRDPVEILASIVRDPLGNLEHLWPAYLGEASGTIQPRGDPLQTCAEVIATACRRVAQVPGVRTLDYRLLPDAASSLVSPFFELVPDVARMATAALPHSKSLRGRRPFQPDSAAKQAVAGARVRALARDVVGPALEVALAALSPLSSSDTRVAPCQ